jgi:cell division protein FtsA
LNDAVVRAGYHIEQMVFAPLAAGVGVLTQEEMEKGAVVVDIGAGSTDVGVFANGSIALGISLPVSSSNITNDISLLLKTSWDEAERLKITHAYAYSKAVSPKDTVNVVQEGHDSARPMQKKVLSEIVEARVREIALMVRSQIQNSGLYSSLPGGLVLTGGGAKLQGTDKVFEENLASFKVRVAEPQVRTRLDQLSGTAVAVGLASFALQCYDELAPPTNSGDWKDRVKSLFSMISSR